MEQEDFVNLYEAENNGLYLLEFRLSPWQALFVFEKGDDVLDKLNNPFTLEYVEKVKSAQVEYYRCAIRNDHDFQIYYLQGGMFNEEIDEWLNEKPNERTERRFICTSNNGSFSFIIQSQ